VKPTHVVLVTTNLSFHRWSLVQPEADPAVVISAT
jgi:hypothetical protein